MSFRNTLVTVLADFIDASVDARDLEIIGNEKGDIIITKIIHSFFSRKKKQYNILGINERSEKKAVPNRAKSAKSCLKKNL
jgi:hypothetical protein